MEVVKGGPRGETREASAAFVARLLVQGKGRLVAVFTASAQVFVGRLLEADSVSVRLATESEALEQPCVLEIDARLVEAVEIVAG